jgi:hypothetical protein
MLNVFACMHGHSHVYLTVHCCTSTCAHHICTYSQVYDSSVPTDLAEKLFTCYGGVARYVLGLPTLEAGNPVAAADVEYHLRHLKQALHSSSVAQVGRLVSLSARPSRTPT